MVVSLLPATVLAAATDSKNSNSKPEDSCSVLAFTSDVHNRSGNKLVINRLTGWITKTQQNEGSFEFMGFCGDMADGSSNITESTYWSLTQDVVDVMENSGVPFYAFTTGNHEQENGRYGIVGEGTTNKTAKLISRNVAATVKPAANYAVYLFGAAPLDGKSDYKFLSNEITMLGNYLESVDKNIPVFVMSHYPLHNTTKRTIKNAQPVIDLLNEYPNVIFIWGHNHTDAGSAEKHYDQIYTGKFDNTSINFTYCAAGCMSGSECGGGSRYVVGKGLVATVTEDHQVTLVYTDADGRELDSPVKISIPQTKPVCQKHDYQYVKTVAPTCTEEGYDLYVCSICNDSDKRNYVQATDHNYENGKCTRCEMKDPAYIPQCVVEKSASLADGNLIFTLGGQKLGEYTFAKSGNGWTIQDKDGKYLGFVDNAFAYVDEPFNWTFSSNRFQTSVTTTSGGNNGGWGFFGFFGWGSASTTTTYYLCYDGSKLTVSTGTTGANAAFAIHVESDTHTGAWTTVGKTHTRKCEICGETETGNCTYGADHKCTVCGGYDPDAVSISVSVSLSQRTSGSSSWGFFSFFGWGGTGSTTTYTADIKATATGAAVSKVEYSTNNGASWTTGTMVTSDSQIADFLIRVTDSNGAVYSFAYENGIVHDVK